LPYVLLLATGAGAVSAHAAVPTAGSTAPGWSALRVIPFPGTPDASPHSQIIFSSLRRTQISSVTAWGSRSGLHRGRVVALPDGAGTAFVPDHPFKAPESVRVTAFLASAAAGTAAGAPRTKALSFTFGVAAPRDWPAGAGAHTGARPAAAGISASRAPVQRYHSQPSLHPPLVHATSNPDHRNGDIFLTPNNSRQHGPMILNGQGQLVWFHHVPDREVFNLKVRSYAGKPVLTWWQGKIVDGHGAHGADVIMNTAYQPVAVLHAGYGYSSDLHEFQVSQGKALIDAYVPVQANLSSVGGSSSGTVLDCVIQELDIRTGRVLWEWHSMGHVPLSASYVGPSSGRPYDYFHINSIQQLSGGKLLVSARNTWAVYMIDEHTGQVDWTLGGKNSNFSLGSGANFEWQHDAVLHRNGLLTLFDDAGIPQEEPESSAKELRVNMSSRTVSLVARFTHSPPVITGAEGSMELFSDHKVFVGWGSTQQFSEYTASGRQIFNGSFVAPVNSYRAYRFVWPGHPQTKGALAVSPGPNGGVTIYASWNGATDVAGWRVLGGRTPNSLAPVGNAKRRGFETAIHVHSEPRYFAVQALDGHGHVLRQTSAVATPAHVDIFGKRAFVSASNGRGTVPVACFTRGSNTCSLQATLSYGGHALATSPHQQFSADHGGLLHFTLSAAGRHQLRQAGAKGLPVEARLRSASGSSATVRLTLISFSTSGPGPKRSVSGSPKVQIVATTDFVSRSGQGAILAACYSSAPCPIRVNVSAAGAPIAASKLQSLGAEELGYLDFQLNPTGRTMLNHASGNQLGAEVRLRSAQGAAGGQVVLVKYG
jgi:hypothetical protein